MKAFLPSSEAPKLDSVSSTAAAEADEINNDKRHKVDNFVMVKL